MWIERLLAEEITKSAQTKPVVLLTGPRQTGKSSLLQKIFTNSCYVTLDRLVTAQAAKESPAAFLSGFEQQKVVILDEIQYAPSLFRDLKIIVDRNRSHFGKWILTGSQQFSLMQHVSESLAGRIRIIHLETLSAKELAPFFNKKQLADFIWKGGYPELWANKSEPRSFFDDYVQTYLEKDLKQLVDVANLHDFRKFLMICATRVGQLINFTDISNTIGVSSVTIKKWIAVLETSGIIYLLPPYYNNLGKRMIKAPKLFFADHGLVSSLLNINDFDSWQQSPMHGAIWENLVFSELVKNSRLVPGRNLFFYRDQNAVEIDFVVDQGHKVALIEAKATENPNAAKLNFHKVAPLFKERQVNCFLACTIVEEKLLRLRDYAVFNPMYCDLVRESEGFSF